MKKIIFFFILSTFVMANDLQNLTLKEAQKIVKKDNLEINIAKFNEEMKTFNFKVAKGYDYGKLDLTQIFARSNDALSVFGEKLMSREADFGDFGFAQFDSTNPEILKVQPHDLNYPGYRNLFQTKLTYKIPLYTGGKLEEYKKIAQEMIKLSKLDTKKMISQKIFQTKKSFFDITLLDSFIKNLNIIIKNMNILENTAKAMIKEGYAKHVDLLEVEAKKSNVQRMLNQAKVNRELVYQFLSFLLNKKVKSIVHVNIDKIIGKVDKKIILANNLNIEKAKTGLKISKMNIKLQESGFLPQIGAVGEVSSSDNNFLNDFSKHKAFSLGIQLKWNIFNGGIDKANLEKARVQNLKAAEQLELAKKGISLKIDKINTKIKSYQFDINSLKIELKLSKEIYRNYLGRYKEKLVSINDVIIKQSQEIDRILNLEKIQTKRNEEILELEKIANGDLK